MNVPVAIPKETAAIHDLVWWDAECRRVGTDWDGVIATHLRALAALGLIESVSSSFELACKRADDVARWRKQGRQ
jgi:hypothetical protein